MVAVNLLELMPQVVEVNEVLEQLVELLFLNELVAARVRSAITTNLSEDIQDIPALG